MGQGKHTRKGCDDWSLWSEFVYFELELLLKRMLLMMRERKTVPPRYPPHIYTLSIDYRCSCQRIVDPQLHSAHASAGSSVPAVERCLACIEPTGRGGDDGTLRFELEYHLPQMQCHPSVVGHA